MSLPVTRPQQMLLSFYSCPSAPNTDCGSYCLRLVVFSAALMGLLGVLDFMFVNHACHSIITRGASVQLVFGFEVGQASLGASAVEPGSVLKATRNV